MSIKLLNLGCGSHFDRRWTNVDFTCTGAGVIAHNLCAGIPFADATFDVVYHSHVLEHFEKKAALVFLRDCHRVLKPGGIIRVAVPDLEQIARSYLVHLENALNGDRASEDNYEWIMLEMFDQMVRNSSGGEMKEYWKKDPIPAENYMISRVGSEAKKYIQAIKNQPAQEAGKKKSFAGLKKILSAEFLKGGLLKLLLQNVPSALEIGRFRTSGEIHQWMYDRYSLRKALEAAGFAQTTLKAADQSWIPNFNTYCLDIEIDGSTRKPDSLFMEARK